MSNDTLSTNKDKNKLLSSSKLLNLELYRNIINKNTLISIGIFLLIKLYVNYDSIILSLRGAFNPNILNFFQNAFGSFLNVLLFASLTVFFGFSFYNDYFSKYYQNYITKTGKKKYIFAKLISMYISIFLVCLISFLLLYFILLNFAWPKEPPYQEFKIDISFYELRNISPFLFIFLLSISYSLYYTIWCAAGFLLSLFISNKKALFILPSLVYTSFFALYSFVPAMRLIDPLYYTRFLLDTGGIFSSFLMGVFIDCLFLYIIYIFSRDRIKKVIKC
ncbi:hypothetical protein VLK81_01755 [Citroniella saccharovorans]|uniref:Uncharacterized protein n=1 Tax=Citroniella saccharovorans TaxID=2053367 RepID=A0AAW9MXJ1_9FIRM|nr:hypothetical protein [Citroniella saccharovorans]MEB3428757.1 hypothetical protein [Citroniella saccharovorans]